MRLSPGSFSLALAIVAWASSAGAFWPFTTKPPPALADTAVVAQRVAHFAAWRKGELYAPPGAAAAAPQASPGAGEPATSALPAVGAALDSASVTAAAADSAAGGPAPPSASSPNSTAFGAGSDGWTDTTAGAGGTAPDSTASAPGTDPAALGAPAPSPSPPAGAPSGTENVAFQAAAAAAALQRGFAPDLTSRMNSTNDAMRMSTDLNVGFTDPSGIALSASLGYGEDISLTQKTDTETSRLGTSFQMPILSQGLRFGVNTTNSRTTTTGAKTYNANVTNNFGSGEGAQADLGISRRLETVPGLGRWAGELRGWSVNASVARSANGSSQEISATQATAASFRERRAVGTAYGAGAGYDRWKFITIRGRLGFQRADNRDMGSGLEGELESESKGDTASIDVSLPSFGRFMHSTTMGFRTSNGIDTNTEPARTAQGTQTGTIGNYVLETKYTFSRIFNFATKLRPIPKLDLNFSLNAARDSTSQELKRNSFRDTQRLGWKLDSKYIFWKDAALAANFESTESDVNLDEGGRPNSGTNRTEDRKLYVELNKSFTKTMQVRAFGEMQLSQQFYANEGLNGRNDKDELRQRIGADFRGNITPFVSANATLYVRTYNQAYIDPRQSRNTRNETEYVVRPGYSWKLNERISVGQNFGLLSKVLENPYQEAQNTLNRSHFMNTTLDYQFTPRLQLSAGYDYLLQDNGQYRYDPLTRESYFSPASRTKKDAIRMGIRYDLVSGGKLTFVSRQDATRERTFTAVTERGNIALGIESKLDFSGLKLDCRANGNRSFNVSLNQRTYFNVDATLQYTF